MSSKVKGKPRTVAGQKRREKFVKGTQPVVAQPGAVSFKSKRKGRSKAQTIDKPVAPTPKPKTPGKADSEPPLSKSPSRMPKPCATNSDRPLQFQPLMNDVKSKMCKGSTRPQSQRGQQEQDKKKSELTLGPKQLEMLKSNKVPPTVFLPKYKWEMGVVGKVMALYDGANKEFLREASKYVEKLAVLLDQTSFFPENKYCGQRSSEGKLTMKLNHFTVEFEVKKVQSVGDYFLHIGTVTKGILKVGNSMKCEVDYEGVKKKVAKEEKQRQEEEQAKKAEPESKYSKYLPNVPWVENKPEPASTFKAKPMWTFGGLLEAGTGRTKECDDPILRQLPDEPTNPGGKSLPTRKVWTAAGPTKLTMKQQADLPLLRQLPEFHKPRMIWTSFGPVPEHELHEITKKTPMADRPLQRQPPIHNQKKKVMYTSFGPVEVKPKKKPAVKPKRPVQAGDRVSVPKVGKTRLATVLIKSGNFLYIDYDDIVDPEWVVRDGVKVGRTIMTSYGPVGIYDDPSRKREVPVRGSRVFLPKPGTIQRENIKNIMGGGNPRTETKEWGTVLCQAGSSYSYVQFDDAKLRPAWVMTSSIPYIRPNSGPSWQQESKFSVTQVVHVPYKSSYTWAEINTVSGGYVELIYEDGKTGWALTDSVVAQPLPRKSVFSEIPKIERGMSVLMLEKTAKPDEPQLAKRAKITDVSENFRQMRLLRPVGQIIENLGDDFMDGKYVEVEYEGPGKKTTEWRNMGAVVRVFTEKPMPMDPTTLKPGMRVKLPKNSSWQWATVTDIEEPYVEVKYDDEKLQQQWVSMSTFKTTSYVTSEEQPLSYSPVSKKRRPRKDRTEIKEKSRRVMKDSPKKDMLANRFKKDKQRSTISG